MVWSLRTAARAASRLRTSSDRVLPSARSKMRLASSAASAGRSGNSRGTGVTLLLYNSTAGAALQEGIDKLRHAGGHPIGRFGELLQHLALGIDDVSFRVHERAVVLVQFGFASVEECRVELFEEGAVGDFVLVHADAEDDHSLGSVGGRELAERGGFLHAGRAPGGPEIEHQELAAEVGQGHDAAV